MFLDRALHSLRFASIASPILGDIRALDTLTHDLVYRAARQFIMSLAKPFKGAPVHPFRSATVAAVQNTTIPAHLVPNTVGLAYSSLPRLLALRLVGQPKAMPACEDCATVEDRNTPTAALSRAEEPMPFITHVAGRRIESDRVSLGLPFTASIPMAVIQDQAARLRLDVD